MTTTGTWAFNPSAADVILNAFGMIGKRRAQLDTEMLTNAAYQAQMVGVDFTNRNPNRWQMETVDFTLVDGTETYTFDPEVVAIAIAYIDVDDAQTRVLGPLSATEYASLANKQQQGTPTSYFFDLRISSPTITIWPVPTASPAYTMHVQVFKQQQDVRVDGGYTLDAPYRFLDAYTFGVAARLALFYPDPARPGLAEMLNAAYETKFKLAAALDQERVPLKVMPTLTLYFPR